MQTFFQNGDEQINGNGDPDLGANGVGPGAVKGFDAQMLLDPFEEEFDLPAATIELGDGQRRNGEVVGQKDQRLAGLGIAIADAAQRDGQYPRKFSFLASPNWAIKKSKSFPCHAPARRTGA